MTIFSPPYQPYGYDQNERNLCHENGTTLLESMMVLALFGAFMIMVSQIITLEQEKQLATSIGKETAFITQAIQRYVGTEYDTLRSDLFTGATSNLIQAISISEIAKKGYVSSALLKEGKFTNALNQEYTLLMRGVNANDTANPQATLTKSDIDTDLDGHIEASFTDGIQTNGEFELEAILITSNGDVLEPHIAGKAIVGAGVYSVGYMELDGIATGQYGTWKLNTAPFATMDGYDSTQSLVSLIALARSGVFGHPKQNKESDEGDVYFDRCEGQIGSVLSSCEANNQLFTEVVFNSFDEDMNGVADFFGSIDNLYSLNMGASVDTDGDSIPDRYGMVRNLKGISCDDTPPAYSRATLNINCDTVSFSDDVTISKDLTVKGNLTTDTSIRSKRFIADALGGQDLTKGIYYANVVNMSQNNSVPKPDCRDRNSEPQIFVTTSSYEIPGGYPIVSVRGIVNNHSTRWTVSMEATIDRDRDKDGYSDVIPLTTSKDRLQVLTRCS